MGCQNWCFANWVMASKTAEPVWKAPVHHHGLPAAVPVAAWVVLRVVHSFGDSPWPHCCRPGWKEAVPLEDLQQHFDKDLLTHQNCGAVLQSGNPLVKETNVAKVVTFWTAAAEESNNSKMPQKNEGVWQHPSAVVCAASQGNECCEMCQRLSFKKRTSQSRIQMSTFSRPLFPLSLLTSFVGLPQD